MIELPQKWRNESGAWQRKSASQRHANELEAALPQWIKMVARFYAKVNQDAPNDCWEWTAHCNEHGYGRMKIDGKHQLAHRVSWLIHNGTIPDIAGSDCRGTCVLHHCDNRKCVNPDHLFLGTHKDNLTDMANKGRSVPVVGDAHVFSKLTYKKVQEIIYKDQFFSQRILASEYGVSQRTIGNIVNRRSWKHVLPPPEELK